MNTSRPHRSEQPRHQPSRSGVWWRSTSAAYASTRSPGSGAGLASTVSLPSRSIGGPVRPRGPQRRAAVHGPVRYPRPLVGHGSAQRARTDATGAHQFRPRRARMAARKPKRPRKDRHGRFAPPARAESSASQTAARCAGGDVRIEGPLRLGQLVVGGHRVVGRRSHVAACPSRLVAALAVRPALGFAGSRTGNARPWDGGGPAGFVHPAHVGQTLTAPQIGHHRFLTLKDSRPARKPSSIARMIGTA